MINYSIKYLTTDESVKTDNLDLKTWKYENKKKHEDSVYDKGKRSYHKLRCSLSKAPSSRALKELESKLKAKTIIHSEWLSESLIMLVLSTGNIIYLSIIIGTQDVTQILFDRYCGSKLGGLTVAGVVFTKSHLLLIHPEGSATLFTFTNKNNDNSIQRISDKNPIVQTIELADYPRRAERHVSWSESLSCGPRVVVWTAAGNDPAPWTPAAEFRANLHVYQINSQTMNLVAYHQLDNETLLADISRTNFSCVHVVEQTHCQKSGVTLDWTRYTIPESSEGVIRLSTHRAAETRVPLPALARNVDRSQCDNRLLVACIDGSLLIVHHVAGLTHSIKTAFGGSRSECMWVGPLVISAAGARLSVHDAALQHLQPTITVHLDNNTTTDSHRESINMNVLASKVLNTGCSLLILLEDGPLAIMKISHPKLPLGWLRAGQLPRAVSLLRAMDWETEGEDCLHTLQTIVKSVLRKGMSAETESCVQEALGTYLTSPTPAPQFHTAVTDVARMFFHHSLRRGRFELCLSLGVDLAAWDLFRDIACSAARVGNQSARDEAEQLALMYRDQHETESECSTCSYTSQSTTSESDDESSSYNETRPPPLPRLPLQNKTNHTTLIKPIQQPTYQTTQLINHHYLNQSKSPYNQSLYQSFNQTITQPNQSTLMYVPINQPEQSTAHSIRPNLHQYLEKESTIWNTEIKEPTPRREGILQSSLKPTEVNRGHERSIRGVVGLYHKDGASNTLYRYQDSGYSQKVKDKNEGRNRTGEKNKVKFSNTVTINVVPESSPAVPQPERELAESLPLCPPHAYLAAFEPAHPHDNSRGAQKPPKIKVVHFGMV